MVNKTLARRLEDLEAEVLRDAGETIIRVNFVEPDGTVVDHKDYTVNAPTPTCHWSRARWRR